MKIKLEYVWLDGYKPEPNLRSKVKVIDWGSDDLSIFSLIKLSDVPQWSFDGSSTQQADGNFSDCILNPVKLYADPIGSGISYIVLCEVLNPDGTPHESNTRSLIESDDEDNWFGFEQEYVLRRSQGNQDPLGFEAFTDQRPDPQGRYYCSVGYPYSSGREISDEHLDACLSCGINLTGTNAEVMLGQREYQVFGKGNKNAGDDLWISRFLLMRIAEKYRLKVDFHPKPMGKEADWNGSGMHVNFSNHQMREIGGKEMFTSILESMEESHQEAIKIYGSDNHLRLTGKHETQSIDKFSWGISDRGASIRIPISTSENWTGYLEDRRPGSNADPYLITSYISNILTRIPEEVYRE